ncbi:MAG: Ppx/GppA phosphatase family protein [Duodenibacillus massiliensis]
MSSQGRSRFRPPHRNHRGPRRGAPRVFWLRAYAPVFPEKRLVVDIGGASTELIIGRGYLPKQCESFHVGCVNTSVQFFKDGKITAKEFKAAQLSAQAEFEEAHQEFSHRQWDAAYGSAGTIGAVADIGTALGLTNGVVTPALLKYLRDELISSGEIRRIKLAGLKEDRREVIAGGIAVLTAVFETFGIKEMRPASGALRVGLLYDILGRKSQHDVRDATVTAILKRTNVDKQQAARVAALSDKFFQALSDGNPDPARRKLLQWAAMLHETGKMISPSGYHRHSEYILKNSDLPGFSRSDQSDMAAIVLSQRGNLKKVESCLKDPMLMRMICAIRLAVIFAHARRTVRLPAWTLKADGKTIEFALDSAWLMKHPLTEYLLHAEEDVWDKMDIDFRFERKNFKADTSAGD